MFIDSFSNANVLDLPKNERTPDRVLECLKVNGRISTWDMSENPWLVHCIEALEAQGKIVSEDSDFPWHQWGAIESEGES